MKCPSFQGSHRCHARAKVDFEPTGSKSQGHTSTLYAKAVDGRCVQEAETYATPLHIVRTQRAKTNSTMNPHHRKVHLPVPSFATATLLLLPLALLAAVLVAVYHNEFALQSYLARPACPSNASDTSLTGRHVAVRVAPDFRLLIGVLTLPGLDERRHLMRTVYALQQANLTARVDVRFFFCRIESDEQRLLVALINTFTAATVSDLTDFR